MQEQDHHYNQFGMDIKMEQDKKDKLDTSGNMVNLLEKKRRKMHWSPEEETPLESNKKHDTNFLDFHHNFKDGNRT